MSIRKGREASIGLEALNLIYQFDAPGQKAHGATVSDPRRREALLDRLRAGMDDSLSREARLHGWRDAGFV